MKYFVVVLAIIACASAADKTDTKKDEKARDKRGYLTGLYPGYDLATDYISPYNSYIAPSIDYAAPAINYAAPAISYAAPAANVVAVNKVINSHRVVDVPQVVNVRKVVAEPQVVTVNKVVPTYGYSSFSSLGYSPLSYGYNAGYGAGYGAYGNGWW